MVLPIYITQNKDLQLLQNNWSKQINPVIDLPINQGQILTSVALKTGSTNTINHGLNRTLQGWFLVRNRAQATVWDSQDSNSNPTQTLLLQTSANVTVDIMVF